MATEEIEKNCKQKESANNQSLIDGTNQSHNVRKIALGQNTKR